MKPMHAAVAGDPATPRERLIETVHGAISALVRRPKPVLPAVNGIAAGGRLAPVLAADLGRASAETPLPMAHRTPEASPEGGSPYFLPRRVGLRKALALTLLGDPLSAEAARRVGLVGAVVPAAGFGAAVATWPAPLVAGPAQAMPSAKTPPRGSLHECQETQMETKRQPGAPFARTSNAAAGVTAFAEKRQPRFARGERAG